MSQQKKELSVEKAVPVTPQERFTSLCYTAISSPALAGALDKQGFSVHSVHNRPESALVSAVHKATGAVVKGVVFKSLSAKERDDRRKQQ